jgi:hypothetical protein
MSRRLLLVTLLAVVMTGCAANIPLQRGQTASLTAGTPADQVAPALGNASVQLAHDFEFEGRTFSARHYALQTGSTQQMTMVCSPVCIPVFYTVPVTQPYVLVFEGKPPRLFAFGMVEELSRSPDADTAKMMPTLKESAERARASQKSK